MGARGRSVEDLIQFIELNALKLFYNEPIDHDSPHPAEEGSDQLALRHGTNLDRPCEYSSQSLRDLCDFLVEIIERCIGPSDIDIKDAVYMKFLTTTLPKIVDLFLKRKTSREHVGDIRRVLMATARLLAQPVSQEIVRLCELRNHLLTANPSFKFFSPDGVYGDRSPMAGGFFLDHGQPETVILNHRYIYFWPWDYEQVIGGSRAIGHFLRIYLDAMWQDGQISKYDSATEAYELVMLPVETPEKIVDPDSPEDPPSESPPPVVVMIDLKKTPHTWIDIYHREKLPKSYSASGKLLTDSEKDAGQYVRAWWPLYHRDYYGKVLSYDPATGLHAVVYEDKDTRSVNMKEKDYEVVSPIPESVLASAAGRSHSSAASIVGTWHRGIVQQNLKFSETQKHVPFPSPSGGRGVFIRPDLSVGMPHNFSYHHADLVDFYFAEGGFSSLFQSLRDTSLTPPDALLIVLHMRFIYSLRQKIQKSTLDDLIWDAKELIPLTILRFEENQIKQMTKSDLNIILNGLKDLVAIGCPTNCNIQREVDILHISVANKLLTCSQIQKRFLGLSILREEIESAMPQISKYLPRQAKPSNFSNRPSAAVQLASIPKKSAVGVEYLEKWILENKIFESIFLRSAHQELIAKSEFLIVFLALRRSLGEDHLNAIWQSSIGGHEAVVRVIHQLILNVIPVLDSSLRLYLFNLISIIPFADYSEQHLHLLKSYTVNAIKLLQKDESQQPPTQQASGGQGTDATREESSLNTDDNLAGGSAAGGGRRGQVINAPPRNWLGFAVLWQFIQDQSASGANNQQILHVDVSLVDMSVDLLVDLLREEFKNDRDVVIQRCVENIRTGTSVPVSAKILHRTLSLYPTSSGGWFSSVGRTGSKQVTITTLIERIHKQHNLIDCLLEELEEYHKVFKEQTRSQSKEKLSPGEVNDFRIKSKGKIGRISHVHGMKERLKLLSVILCNSPISLHENHLSTLWKVFVTESLSAEVTDGFIKWLGSCLSLESKQFNTFLSIIIQEGDGSSQCSKLDLLRLETVSNGDFNAEKITGTEDGEYPQSFEEGVLKSLLDAKLGPLAAASSNIFSQFCRRSMAVFVIKLFLFVNTSSTTKSIRLENDSSWYRSVTVEPIGLPFLWRLATDSEDDAVSAAASFLLIEIFQRMPSSKVKDADSIRGSFLQYCFSQISVSVNLLQEVELSVADENSVYPLVESSILTLRVKRYVSLMKDFVQRFTHSPKQFSRIVVLSNRSLSKMFELNVTLDDPIFVLRSQVSQRLQLSPESLAMSRTKLNPTTNEIGPLEKLDKDEVTLRALKFRPLEYIVVTRLENVDEEKTVGSKEGTIGKVKKEDVILSKHLTSNFIPPLNPFEWLGMELDLHTDHILHLNEPVPSLSEPSRDSSKMFVMPKCPLHYHSDMVLENRGSVSSSQHSNKSEHIARLAEYLGPYLLHHPNHFDHLLQILDGYLSLKPESDEGVSVPSDNEISMALWEVVQSLPAHLSLLSQLRSLESSEDSFVFFRKLIDVNCPYRMLYTLQMIDSLSTSEPEEHLLIGGWKFQRSILEWLWKLVSMGFPDFLLGLIKDVICLCQEIKQTSHSSRLDSTPDTQVTPTVEMAVTRNDAYTLSLVLMLRILHKFLMLDNQFAKWQMHGPLAGDALAPGDFLSNHIPPGTILSLIKVDTFIPLLMKTMIAVLQRVIPSNFTSVSTSLALVEHSILVIFGLLQSVDQPVEILNSYPDFYRWIRSSLLRVPAKEIRRASARRILECSALMLLRCRDATDFSSAEKASRVELFHHLFFSVLKATHPGFDGSLGGQQPIVLRQGTDSHSELSDSQEACVARDAYSLLGPEHYRNGEELYNLIAGLLTLRSRPEILNAIKIGSLEEVCGSPETAPANWIREENLCFFFVERLFTHRSLETFHSSISDGTLLGLLRALIVISHASPQCQILLGRIRLPSFLPPSHHQTSSVTLIGLIRFLYFHCLFPQSGPTTNQNRVAAVVGICQTPNSRQLVYALLLGLCGSNKENLTQLLEVLTATSASSRGGLSNVPGKKVRRRLWEYDPSALLKPSGASLGLVNQGATCYMNSFLQQLYHVKCFSNHLLEIDCDPTESDNATVLFELQVLFGYLRFSQKNYCDTLSFCKSFKDYDGEPVRLGEQKDVNEFAAMLFEKLETNEDCKSLLQNCFGGKLVWQIISTESTYRSEREEPFFMLTAEVKDKSSLEDSLELYVTGEMLSGDNKIEDSTGKKVDALRRCTIRTLPEVLIIHLKRFEFDLETMNRQKLNDLISFPEELDMFPYTEVGIQQSEERRKARAETSDPSNGEDEEQEQVEGVVAEEDLTTSTMDEENETNESKGNDDPPSLKPPSLEPIPDPVGRGQYEYRLKGIVAHTGAIDSGHYYSFIRNENGNAWMEYNDSSVLCFDSGSIPGECFGGPLKKPSTGSHPGGAPAPVSPQAMKQYNAYILVYERKGEESNGKFPFSPRKNPKPQEGSPKAGDSSVESSHADSPTENGSSDMPVVEVETEEILRPRDRSASMLVDCEDDLPKNGRNLASRAGGISGSISDGVMQAVWSENTAFLLDRTRFNIEYILFYWKLLDLPLIGSLQEEITAREEAGNSMSLSPGDQNSSSHLSNQILSKLSLSCFEFCVEILARARAHQCLPHFVEKLEDIVMRDISGSSAESILSALARDPESPLLPLSGQSPLPPGTPENIQSQPSHSSSLSLGGRLQEDRDIVSKVDQMLITMFVDCPHTFTTSTFSRLLMWCIKILRRRHSSFYLSTFPPKAPLLSEHADLPREEGSPEPDATCDPVQAQRMLEERMEACHQYQSCVTRFVGKLLILTDFYQPEDLMERRGNESLSDLLMRFACLGDEEKNVLINFGAIYRVVCSSIVLYPAHRQYPARDCLRNSIDLVTVLVRASRFTDSPSTAKTLNLLPMSSSDSQAFTNRSFLETALLISPSAVTSALQHICLLSGTREILKVLTSLVEKVADCALATQRPPGSPSMKIYFAAISDVILSLGIPPPSSSSRSPHSPLPALPYDLDSVLQEIVPLIVSKTAQIAQRHNKEDTEYVFLVSCFLYRLGIQSESGLKVVSSMRDYWKRFSAEVRFKPKNPQQLDPRRIHR